MVKNNKTHELKSDGIGMLLKEYNPKYKMVEIIEENDFIGNPIGIFTLKQAKKRYGDWIIASIMDFNDTRTTSVIIEKRDLA